MIKNLTIIAVGVAIAVFCIGPLSDRKERRIWLWLLSLLGGVALAGYGFFELLEGIR